MNNESRTLMFLNVSRSKLLLNDLVQIGLRKKAQSLFFATVSVLLSTMCQRMLRISVANFQQSLECCHVGFVRYVCVLKSG